DGIKQAAEQCDLGANNSNTGTCTLACTLAKCGDGFKQVSNNEECDDGNGSNGDACLNSCKAAKCGDGHLWSGNEQCDDGNVVGNDGCNGNCTKPKRVFVTSTSWNGNLGGISGSDSKCQGRANAAVLGGSWRAWTSAGSNSPNSRFNKSTTGYARLDGLEVAQTWADLTDNTIDVPINRNENNQFVGEADVWTGTNGSGTGSGSNCNSWTSGSLFNTGREGRNFLTNVEWTFHDSLVIQLC